MSLQDFYDKLHKTLKDKNKLKHESCLVSLAFGVKSNDRNDLIKSAALDKNEINSSERSRLVDLNFIREIENTGKFEITAQGIWNLENKSIIDSEGLISYIDKERFFVKVKGMSDKEKIIIFSMICGRAFSDESQIDLVDQDLLENWSTVLDNSFKKLSEIGVIKITKNTWEKSLYKKGTEHPVSVIIRHTDALPKKVDRIFKAPGDQKYYLEIMENNEPDLDKLAYLFKKVFEDIMDLTNVDEILNHCKSVFIENGKFLYKDGSQFSHPKYDMYLKEASEKVIFSI